MRAASPRPALHVGMTCVIGGDHPDRMEVGILEARSGMALLVRLHSGKVVEVAKRADVEAVNAKVPGASKREALRETCRVDRTAAKKSGGSPARAIQRGNTALGRAVLERWRLRACWMCLRFGKCQHREWDVAVAELDRASQLDAERAA